MEQAPLQIPASEQRPFGGKGRLILVGLVLALAIAYLIYAAFPGSTSYYFTVEEMAAFEGELAERSFRVKGSLVPDSFQREAETTKASFALASGSETMQASYDGVVPDLFFNEHSDIILLGSYEDGEVFHAVTVSVLCPTKYQALEEASVPSTSSGEGL